jgi:hypothetical protein
VWNEKDGTWTADNVQQGTGSGQVIWDSEGKEIYATSTEDAGDHWGFPVTEVSESVRDENGDLVLSLTFTDADGNTVMTWKDGKSQNFDPTTCNPTVDNERYKPPAGEPPKPGQPPRPEGVPEGSTLNDVGQWIHPVNEDGTQNWTDAHDGTTVVFTPDGKETHTFPDGTKKEVVGQYYISTTPPDGKTTYLDVYGKPTPDGKPSTMPFPHADGTNTYLDPDGNPTPDGQPYKPPAGEQPTPGEDVPDGSTTTKDFTDPYGNRHEYGPDGKKISLTTPDGTKYEFDD